MTTLCTSCGTQIPSYLTIYKCRQCINHFVCEFCKEKSHNQASIPFHTLEKIFGTQSAAVSSSTIDNNPQQLNVNTSPKSSIFTSDDYLYTSLGYCDHCYRLFSSEKEAVFPCEQCPNNFVACAQCFPLMSTHHPSMHTFAKPVPRSDFAKTVHDWHHTDITCDGCAKNSFNGKRYRCVECPPSYDLCEDCFGKEHTHHEFKYIQHPMLHAGNQQILGRRTLELAEKNIDNSWRDPLTGWTKSDAEKVIEQAKHEKQVLKDRSQELDAASKRQLEATRERLNDTIAHGQRMQSLWAFSLANSIKF